MPPLDLHDAAGRREDLLGPDHGRGAVVGAHPGVLEDVREAQERLLVREGAAEAQARLLDRGAAGALDGGLERVDVLVLVRADLLGQRAHLPGHVHAVERPGVEARLEVLEGERVVEDVNVPLAALGERARDERGEGAGAEDRARRHRGAQQEGAAGGAGDLDLGQLGGLVGAHVSALSTR